MGKLLVPNHDPARLRRVLDDRQRLIGVDREALDRQVQERREALQREREAERAQGASSCLTDQMLCMRQGAAEQRRRAAEAAVAQELKQQQASRQAGAVQAAAAEAAAAAAELAAALESPWLGESPEVARSALAPHRVRPDHYKGMSAEQRAAILAAQAAQVQAGREAEAAEAADAAAYDASQAAIAAALAQKAAQAEAARAAAAARLRSELEAQAAEKRCRDGAAAAGDAALAPTEGYFRQWGASHR